MNFKEIAQSIIKSLSPFPCKCGGTFNQCRTKESFPIVLVYECSDCGRETEQTLDIPSLDELTPKLKAETNELIAKIMRTAQRK